MKCHIRLLVLLIIYNSSSINSFSQPSIDNKINYFYIDALNEYVLHSNTGGRILISTNNGELVLKGNKKYIKPARLGEIVITLEEITTESRLKTVQYYKCIPMPDASLFYSTITRDTLPLADTISKLSFRNITSFIPKIPDENVLASCTLVSCKIEIFRKKGGLFKGSTSTISLDNLPEVIAGDRVLITKVLINVEGVKDSIHLRNRLIEITE